MRVHCIWWCTFFKESRERNEWNPLLYRSISPFFSLLNVRQSFDDRFVIFLNFSSALSSKALRRLRITYSSTNFFLISCVRLCLLHQFILSILYIAVCLMLKWAVTPRLCGDFYERDGMLNHDGHESVTLQDLLAQHQLPCLVRLINEDGSDPLDNYCLLLCETQDPYLVASNETERFAIPTSFDGTYEN